MSCEKCWKFPCNCGKQYEHMATKDIKQILANLSIRDNRELWTALTVLVEERKIIDDSWSGPENR